MSVCAPFPWDCPAGVTEEGVLPMVREGLAYCRAVVADLSGILRAFPDNPCSITLPNIKEIGAQGQLGHARRCLETAEAVFTANCL